MTYPVNTVLYTKDGRHIGNAIVIGHTGKSNIIKTDYGNKATLSDDEIKEIFHDPDDLTISAWPLPSHKNYSPQI
jgi:hypothetical protein